MIAAPPPISYVALSRKRTNTVVALSFFLVLIALPCFNAEGRHPRRGTPLGDQQPGALDVEVFRKSDNKGVLNAPDEKDVNDVRKRPASSSSSSFLIKPEHVAGHQAFITAHNVETGKQQTVVLGEIIGGQRRGDLANYITEESWDIIPKCDFYQNNENSCDPVAGYSPCLYCKVSVMRWFGSPSCPDEASLVNQYRNRYHWVLKPISLKGKLKKQYLCVLEPNYQGTSAQQDQDAMASQQQYMMPSYAAASRVVEQLGLCAMLALAVILLSSE